jgi:predicted exporter
MRLRHAPLWAVVAVAAAAATYDVAAFEVTHDITSFLPAGEKRELMRVSSALSRSDLSRTMVLTVGAGEAGAAEEARRLLVAHLASDPAVESVHSEIDDTIQRVFYDLYFPRRMAFLVDDPADASAHLSDDALRDRVRALKDALAGATSPFISRIAPNDPLLAFPDLLERLTPRGAGAVRAEGGRLVTADGGHFVVVATTRASAFDASAQGPFLDRLRKARRAIEERTGRGARIEMTGAHPYAVASERSIRTDVQRISTASVVAIVLLFLLAFRSLRPPTVGLLPIGIGFAVALAVLLATTGRVHGVTLAFGAALIGVGIDYATHFYSHLFLSPKDEDTAATMRGVWPGVAMGAITTVVGVASLALSPFGPMREIGLFATVGVLAAMIAARFVLPPLSRPATAPPATHRLAARMARGTAALARPRRLGLLALGTLALCAVGVPRFGWVDDVTALTSVPDEVRAEAERVQARIGRPRGGRFVVVVGDTRQQALQRNDHTARLLEDARSAGEIDGFQGISRLLPSEETQRARARAVREAPHLWERLRGILEDEGFRPALFEPFAEALEAPDPEPLRFEDLEDGPLRPMVAPLLVDLNGEVAAITPVTGVEAPERLEARLGAVAGAHYFDQDALLEEAYGSLRQSTLWLIGLGLLLVMAALLLRYRHLPTALAVFAPAALAVVAAVAVQGLWGGAGNLMTVVAILLVLSMGVDYGVFVAEAVRHGRPLDAPVLSLSLGALTTGLSFGALAASSNAALAAIGTTTALGVLFAAVLVPPCAAAASGRVPVGPPVMDGKGPRGHGAGTMVGP